MLRTAKPVRTLKISNPQQEVGVESNLLSNIILVSKFAFESENENELSIRKGDILKLIDRPGTGWLLVKFIDKMTKPGLVPASYVDIAINDTSNPITLKWLHETNNDGGLFDYDNTDYLELQVKNLLKLNSPITINNRPYPVSALVSNVLSANDRFWYRVDVTMSNQSKVYLCRYYQNFYNLHLSLLESMSKQKDIERDSAKLPKLPEPIPSHNSESLKETLSKRAFDLNVYVNGLVANEKVQFSKILIDWVDVSFNGLPGFVIDKSDDFCLTSQEICERLLEGSVNMTEDDKDVDPETSKDESLEDASDVFEHADNSEGETSSDKIDSEAQDLPKRSKSKNIYNHYQQATTIPKFHNASKTPNLPKIPLSYGKSSGFGSPTPRRNSVQSLQFHDQPSMSALVNQKKVVSNDSSSPLMTKTSSKVSYSPTMKKTFSMGPSYSPTMKRTPTMGHAYTHQITKSPVSSSPEEFSPVGYSPSLNKNTIKCKIFNSYNQEMVAARFRKSSILSTDDLKSLVSQRVQFTKLLIRLPNMRHFESIDDINFNIVEFMKYNDKVILKTG